MTMLNGLLAVALAAIFPGDTDIPSPTAAVERMTAFQAKLVHTGDGSSIEDCVILVKGGVITQVGANIKVPSGAELIVHDGALSPGLIALQSEDGAVGELNESTRTVMPEAEARYAFNPEHKDFSRALGVGITTLVLAPSPRSLIGGRTAVVKTSGGRVVKPAAQLMLGLSSDALNRNKFPTSYAGAMGELEKQFSNPEGSVSRAAGGSLPVLMDVNDRAETLRAIAFAARFDLKGALYGSYWAEDVVPAIKESGLDVVCTPFNVGEGSRGIRSVVGLSKAGVRIGFGLEAPDRHPESLRFGVALCVRDGLSPSAGMKALTGDAAAIAGVSGRVGRIARGLDADLVLWSADPVALSSTVKAVYIDGKLVHGGNQ